MFKILKAIALGISLPVLAAFFLLSCLPDPLEVREVPTVEPELVVASQIIPDEEIVVWLTSTFGILEASEDSEPEEVLNQIAVNDAQVMISGPGGTNTLEFFERGLYVGQKIPFKEWETYELLVKSETLGEIKASATVLPQVEFESVRARLYYNIYDDTLKQVIYSITDPPEKNWYMINVQKIEREKGEKLIREAINPETITFLLDDADFPGLAYEGHLDFENEGFTPDDSIAVSLSNISEEYFRFMEQRLKNRLSLMEFLSEPVNYPTNVIGGKGYFTLHVPDIRFLPLEED